MECRMKIKVSSKERKSEEGDFCKKVITPWLKEQGIYYFKPRGGPYSSRPGIADYILCIGGQFIALEAKKNSGKQTDLQKAEETKVHVAGAMYIVARPDNWTFTRKFLAECVKRDREAAIEKIAEMRGL